MRMEAAVGRDVEKLKSVAILNKINWIVGVPGIRSIDRLSGDIKWLGHVLEEPYIVLILVRVQSDLLLLATGWVHEIV